MEVKLSPAAAKALSDAIQAGLDLGDIPELRLYDITGASIVMRSHIDRIPPFNVLLTFRIDGPLRI